VGNLETARDFVDVRDGVRALWILPDKGIVAERYNICCGKAWSIRETLKMLVKISGDEVRVEHDSARLRPSDETLLVGSPAKLQRLGWEARIPFEKTLEDIFHNWMERLSRI